MSKPYTLFDYWREAIACFLEEVGVELTNGQLDTVALSLVVADENKWMAFGRSGQ